MFNWLIYGYNLFKDSCGIQVGFCAEKHPSLWNTIPQIEELQSAWEDKQTNSKFVHFHNVLQDGLDKIKKYYIKFDAKSAVLLSVHK